MAGTARSGWLLAGLALLVSIGGLAATINVPGDHETIQAAINAASPGDTIQVAAGTYTENVTVNKTVGLVGAAGAVLQGSGGNGFLIQAPNISIQGFEIKGYAIGVRTYGGPSNFDTLELRDLVITGNTIGMQVNRDGFSTLTVDGCQITGNTQEGMSVIDHLLGALQIGTFIIKDSNVSNNGRHGMMLVRTKIDTLSIENSSFDGATTNGYSGISFVSSPSQVGTFIMSGGSLSGNKGSGLSVTQVGHMLGDIVLDGVALQGNRENGIILGGGAAAGSLSILNSFFSGNGWEELDISGGWFGSFAVTGATTIQGNSFVRSGGTWVAIYIGNLASFGAVPRITGNNIIGYGIAHYAGAFLVDFSGNWWGTAAGRVLGGNSAYSPWLANNIAEPNWTFVVDDVGTKPPEGWLQAALNQARSGDTVLVKAGEYVTQGVVGVSVQIIGEPGAVVKSPGSQTYTIAESGSVFDPVIFAYGGTIAGTHVSGPEISFTDVLFLTVDGQSTIPPGGSRLVGILYRNVQGTIQGNTLQNLMPGGSGSAAQTFGILVYGDSVVDIIGNVVSDYSRGGIGVVGDVVGWTRGPAPDPVANIVGNVVTGNGLEAATGWWAENGIQIGYGATGQIVGNVVSNHWVNNPNWTSTGILVVGSDGVDVLGNYVFDNETGIAVMGLTPWGGEPANNNNIVGNTVLDGDYGISLQYDALSTTIERNVLSGNYIAINGFGWGGAEPAGSAIRFNSIAGNVFGVVNYDLPYAVVSGLDAALNWWGSTEGPTAATNPGGDGDAIYGDVIYSPWLGTNPDGDPTQPGVQITGPMLIIVAPVGPEPAGGYLNTAIAGANTLPFADTIRVREGTYDASTPITGPVSIFSCTSCPNPTTLTGDMTFDAAGILIGRMGQGFTILGDITVGAGMDASTIHINWNDLFGTVTNDGVGMLDATYNWWGGAPPSTRTFGSVNYDPYLPKPVCEVLAFMEKHGLNPDEAIIALGSGAPNHLLFLMWLAGRLGVSVTDAEDLVEEYGSSTILSALDRTTDFDDFVRLLLGYGAAPAGGAGMFVDLGVAGGAGSFQGQTVDAIYEIGQPILVSFELLDFQGNPVLGIGAWVTLIQLHEDGHQTIWYWGATYYNPETGLQEISIPTAGLPAGYYNLGIGFRDGTQEQILIQIVVE